MSARVKTCLWFDQEAEEAANFYVSLLPDSRVDSIFRPDPSGPPLVVEFTLGGTPYQGLNGGPLFRFNEAASISVRTRDQSETDRLWTTLTEGGTESMCGWLKDRYGLSWQIVPETLTSFLSHADRMAAGRAMQAMMQMRKLDIGVVERAFLGL